MATTKEVKRIQNGIAKAREAQEQVARWDAEFELGANERDDRDLILFMLESASHEDVRATHIWKCILHALQAHYIVPSQPPEKIIGVVEQIIRGELPTHVRVATLFACLLVPSVARIFRATWMTAAERADILGANRPMGDNVEMYTFAYGRCCPDPQKVPGDAQAVVAVADDPSMEIAPVALEDGDTVTYATRARIGHPESFDAWQMGTLLPIVTNNNDASNAGSHDARRYNLAHDAWSSYVVEVGYCGTEIQTQR